MKKARTDKKRKMSEDNIIITNRMFLVMILTRIEGKKAKILLDLYEVEDVPCGGESNEDILPAL